jgi:hypothetical protein
MEPIQPVVPQLKLIGRCRADLGEPLELGRTPWGRRRVIPIAGAADYLWLNRIVAVASAVRLADQVIYDAYAVT